MLSLTQFTPLAAGCCFRLLALLCATYDLMECHTSHRPRGPGGRRMECLTVVLPHHCPCGQATTAYPLRSGHEVCRIGTPPAAYFLSPSSMAHRQSCQSRQSRLVSPPTSMPDALPMASVSSVSSVPHSNGVSLVSLVSPPSFMPDALPMAAGSPRPLRPDSFAKYAGRRGEGCRPPTPRETTSTLDFTLGFVSSSTRSPDSGLTHAPQPRFFSLRSKRKRCHSPQSLFFSSARLA